MHNRLVDKILQCPMHVVLTLRTKTEYVIEEGSNGKKSPRKIGMAPIFRDGIEFEVTVFFELDQSHAATATKDRTGLFDGQYFLIAPDTGAKIQSWLADATPAVDSTQDKAPSSAPEPKPTIAELVDATVRAYCANLSREEKEQVASAIRSITGGTSNYRAVTDEAILRRIYERFRPATDEEV